MSSTVQNRPRIPVGPRRSPVARALGALTILVAIVIGIPVVLVALGRALPVDLAALGLGGLARPDDGGLLLLLLLAVAWAAWAVVVLTVALEVWAALRCVPTPRLPGLGGPQRLAALLVASVIVLGSPGGAHGTAAASATGIAPIASLQAARSLLPVPPQSQGMLSEGSTGQKAGASGAEADPLASSRGRISDGTAPQAGRAELPTIITQRHDTLWLLAEHHLGSGERFTEIVALNSGIPQSDGRALGPDGRLYPGWALRMPADAVLETARAERHRVQRGDTLWQIADDELGDPTRYPEIYRANSGDLQPDGRRLADPDLILPGWVLEIPTGDVTEAPTGDVTEAPAGDVTEAPTGDVTEAPAGDVTEAPAGAFEDLPEPGPRQGAPSHDDAVPLLDRAPIPSDGRSELPTARPTRSGSLPTASPSRTPSAGTRPADLPPIDRAVADAPEAGFLIPAGGTLAALLLAGLAGEVTRRRRQFQRHRRPGERMVAPDPGGRELEGLARAAAEEPGPDLLERALGQLADEARTVGVAMPPVRLVRVSAAEVQLELAEPTATAIAPFRAVDDRRWLLDPDQLRPEPSDVGRALPGLVTLGVAGEETILLDVAEVGTLRIGGASEAVPGVLRALASELALGPARDATSRTLFLIDLVLSEAIVAAMEAGELAVEGDPVRMAATVAAATRRGEPDPVLGDPIELVLADRPLPVDVPGRSGVGLITTDPAALAGATLDLDCRGSAVLRPDGVALVPQALGASATAHLAGLLAATHLPPAPAGPDEPLTSAEPAGELAEPAETPSPAPPTVSAAPTPTTESAPRILLLGEVRVQGATGAVDATRVGRLAETVAFVLLNPDARPSELQSALWPSRRANPQTCRQMISRARTWLGRTDDGEAYLMPFSATGGRLRLRDEVGSDWADFQRLAGIGLADPDDVEHLAAALRLVRGRPFGAVAARELPWADLHLNDMVSLITDVAHALAARHERAGRWSAARDAALRGLLTESESESLGEILARVTRGE